MLVKEKTENVITESEIANKYFHSNEKGCQLEERSRPVSVYHDGVKDKPHQYHYRYCLLHERDVCRCGWQLGYHFGKRAT